MKGVEDALGRLEGVRDLRIDLQSNRVTITPAPRRLLDLAAVPEAIRRAGFRPEGLRIVARGTMEREGVRVSFRIAAWPEAYALEDPPPVDPRENFVLEADVVLDRGKVRLRPVKIPPPG
jgi:hypothetical protein